MSRKEKAPASINRAILSQQVKKWLASCRDQRLLEIYHREVHYLESAENRLNQAKGDGWYSEYQASHLRFYRRFAIFYRYEDTELYILAIMGKARNDRDYEFA